MATVWYEPSSAASSSASPAVHEAPATHEAPAAPSFLPEYYNSQPYPRTNSIISGSSTATSSSSSAGHTPSPRTRHLDSNIQISMLAVIKPETLEPLASLKGLFSPESAEKTSPPRPAKRTHVTMKCGWICLDCRVVEYRIKDLQSHLCKGHSIHKKVLSAGYMCQNCPAISDDIATFMNEECPCSFQEGLSPPRAYAASPAARSAARDVPECAGGRHTPLSIRKRPGRIGGEFLEMPHVPPEPPMEAAPTLAEPAPTKAKPAPTKAEPAPTKPKPVPTKPMAASSVMPDPSKPKCEPKQTWTDLTPSSKAVAGGSTKPEKTHPAEDYKAVANATPNAVPTTVASTPEHKPIHQPLARTEVHSALQVAQKELQQLLLLQALESERENLEKLLFQKAQAGARGNNNGI